MKKRLYKSNTNKVFFGTLGGIGEYFNIDPTIVRIAYVILSFCTVAFPGVLLYIILSLIIPKKLSSNKKEDDTFDEF